MSLSILGKGTRLPLKLYGEKYKLLPQTVRELWHALTCSFHKAFCSVTRFLCLHRNKVTRHVGDCPFKLHTHFALDFSFYYSGRKNCSVVLIFALSARLQNDRSWAGLCVLYEINTCIVVRRDIFRLYFVMWHNLNNVHMQKASAAIDDITTGSASEECLLGTHCQFTGGYHRTSIYWYHRSIRCRGYCICTRLIIAPGFCHVWLCLKKHFFKHCASFLVVKCYV